MVLTVALEPTERLSLLTLKPASFYNIEKHVNHALILKVNYACCVHITDRGLITYQRVQAPFTHKMKALKQAFF